MSVLASFVVSFSLLDVPIGIDADSGDKVMNGVNNKTAKEFSL